jgi:hypothetical protein
MKHRKLRIAWSVAWGIVAALLVALWVRSYASRDILTWQITAEHWLIVESMRGMVSGMSTIFGSKRRWQTQRLYPGKQVESSLESQLSATLGFRRMVFPDGGVLIGSWCCLQP